MNMLQAIITVASLCSSFISTPTYSALINSGSYTSDTETGLDWLRWETTKKQSYNFVSNEFGAGGLYEGWRYATSGNAQQFLANFGFNSYINDWTSNPTSNWDLLASYMGFDSDANPNGVFIYGMVETLGANTLAWTYAHRLDTRTDEAAYAFWRYNKNLEYDFLGSFLVRETVSLVPIPAAAWLFGSGLLGLIGLARRMKA